MPLHYPSRSLPWLEGFLSRLRQQAARYKDFISYLLRGNPADLVLQQFEAGAKCSDAPSGLGLLTMVSDYAAELGWRFESREDDLEAVTVTTSAVFSLQSLPEVSP